MKLYPRSWSYSSADGFQVVYDREIPLELRYTAIILSSSNLWNYRLQDANAGPQDVGTLESIKTRVLIQVITANT